MGMFDSVYVKCPACGEILEFQSKGGDCILATYGLEDAPADVMQDVNRHSPRECPNCDSWVAIVYGPRIRKAVIIEEDN